MTDLILESVEIEELPLIERDALPTFPESMECRLFNKKGLEPCVVLYHPQAEMHVLVPLTDLANLEHYVEQVNFAVLKQAMGEPPDDGGYYRIT